MDEPDLLELIARRIAFSVPELARSTSEEQWNAVFSEVLDYRQTRSFNYLIDRTLRRHSRRMCGLPLTGAGISRRMCGMCEDPSAAPRETAHRARVIPRA